MKESLTPEENARMLAYRQYKFERALQPVDKVEGEKALRRLMQLAGYDTGKVVWVASPRVAQVVIANLMGVKAKLKAGKKTLELAKESLQGLGKDLTCEGTNSIRNPWWTGDGFDNGWTAFYNFASSIIPEKDRVEEEKLKLFDILSDTTSWIYSYEGISILTERPITTWTSKFIADRPVLHNVEGPSVKYPDWELFHYRGTQVPRDFIMNRSKFTPEEALTWPNMEQRQALCELIGWEPIILSLGNKVKVIDQDPDPKFGSLLRVDLPNAPGQQFLRARCGTGRMITIQVDENARTAREAGASSYGISVKLYEQIQQRT